jgi:hypothetical protein
MSAVPSVINPSSRKTSFNKITVGAGINQVHETKQGRISNRPVNGRTVDEYPIELVNTTLADLPPNGLHFRRKSVKSVFRKNGMTSPGWGNYVSPGTSKFPFGDMKIGNSFFVKLFDATPAELSRIKSSVRSSMYGHIRRGHLPTLFSLSAVFAEKNGELGVAFFRVS